MPTTSGRATSHPHWHTNDSALLETSPTPLSASSRPIAIQLPPAKSTAADGTPVRTPPAPLSARGDLPGGYFPLHEEQTRTYQPHPFHLDATKARKRSIQIAHKESQSPTTLPTSSKTADSSYFAATAPASASPTMARSSNLKAPESSSSRIRASAASPTSSRTTTPVAAYNPGPYSENPLPMGKYYPSNYEQRKADKHGRQLASPSSSKHARSPSATGSSGREHIGPGQPRHESDAKRRIQQYQRDMIAQATLALNNGSLSPAALQSLRSIGFGSISNSNPSKPRLEPLGSPGPVTPMELGGSDGYLSAHGPVDAVQVEEIARVIRAEDERKRREGAISPAVELGPITF
ncbi:uncharacterized protein B0I36DRAFT_325753 [Microdochium trichocladiopsis]|uniref:Uncharacterized protein n=1 Tax=Microdochium trichocladiopsis TaxID=1682393 RepID=A0A9P9BPN7_9PEZI|nr:uncharacterized protein B0I36DRAFT_325753 [Microdochium trichocladiopsis]KAH7029427.1 hypothetical protein B0I36DRAFT_325753 [Microdochium trichocladiopsis]